MQACTANTAAMNVPVDNSAEDVPVQPDNFSEDVPVQPDNFVEVVFPVQPDTVEVVPVQPDYSAGDVPVQSDAASNVSQDSALYSLRYIYGEDYDADGEGGEEVVEETVLLTSTQNDDQNAS